MLAIQISSHVRTLLPIPIGKAFYYIWKLNKSEIVLYLRDNRCTPLDDGVHRLRRRRRRVRRYRCAPGPRTRNRPPDRVHPRSQLIRNVHIRHRRLVGQQLPRRLQRRRSK